MINNCTYVSHTIKYYNIYIQYTSLTATVAVFLWMPAKILSCVNGDDILIIIICGLRLSLNNCLRQKSQKKVKLVDLLTCAFNNNSRICNTWLDSYDNAVKEIVTHIYDIVISWGVVFFIQPPETPSKSCMLFSFVSFRYKIFNL